MKTLTHPQFVNVLYPSGAHFHLLLRSLLVKRDLIYYDGSVMLLVIISDAHCNVADFQ